MSTNKDQTETEPPVVFLECVPPYEGTESGHSGIIYDAAHFCVARAGNICAETFFVQSVELVFLPHVQLTTSAIFGAAWEDGKCLDPSHGALRLAGYLRRCIGLIGFFCGASLSGRGNHVHGSGRIYR